MSSRDKIVSEDLDRLATKLAEHEQTADSLSEHAASNGAFAHRDLYYDAAARLTEARIAAARAAEILDPDRTSAEAYE